MSTEIDKQTEPTLGHHLDSIVEKIVEKIVDGVRNLNRQSQNCRVVLLVGVVGTAHQGP